MQVLLDRFFSLKKSKNNTDTNPNPPSTKRFPSIKKKWIKKKHKTVLIDREQQQKQEELLTQCISNALYNQPKRWSTPEKIQAASAITFQEDPQEKKPRTRKLSLPPQLSNIGYLASIPEAEDSQTTLSKH